MAEPLKLFQLFRAHDIDYAVIDKVAAALNGVPVLATSIVVCPADTQENNAKLANALNQIHPQWRFEGQAHGVDVDAHMLAERRTDQEAGYGISFQTDFGIVDLIYFPLIKEN